MIPFQDLNKTNTELMPAFLAASERVLKSGRFINGPEVSAFEKNLASISGAKYCVAVSTGLDALRLILKAWMELGKLKPGDEVIIPANTFIATFLAVTDCGLTAVAADVEESTFCLDLNRLPLSSKTKVVIPVHLFGRPCWDAKVMENLRKKGILILEDNAQAIGASFQGIPTGNLGDAAAISFYPAKNVGAFGDAGAVLTNDKKLAEKVRMLANYGSKEKYHHELCGLNCRMDELQAALLIEKLKNLESINHRRNTNARMYERHIKSESIIKPLIPDLNSPISHVWHQYVIRHPQRDDLRKYLAENGIGTEIHYPITCHRQPCYSGHPLLKIPNGKVPVAEKLANEILSLPIADVSEEDIIIIAKTIDSFN